MQPEHLVDGKRVLIIGGTGSLGKILVRRILSGELGTPARVIVLSRDEAKQHDMRLNYLRRRVTADEVIYRNFVKSLEFRLGDVRSFADVASALRGVDVVINAAALKQVPNCEYFPDQAVLTNCIGPQNIVRAIRENALAIETVVGISTDKACKPINVMGMTKAIHERIFAAANILNPETRFVSVRYGNVLGSRGSVIPLFHEQILQGGPVTVTVPTMTRFLMSLDQAVDCVFEALRSARPGETYVPCMHSATIIDIAKALVGKRGIGIRTTGIRPGEKLHEIIISDEEAQYTVRRGDYLAIRSMLPELQSHAAEAIAGMTREYSSADSVIDLDETRRMLSLHRMLVEQAPQIQGVELFETVAA